MKEIQLTRGKVALVDDDDFKYLNQFKWHCTSTGYAARRTYNGKKSIITYMHRCIINPSQGLRIDHKDGNGLNNQKYNIRACTARQNSQNKKSVGKSKYKGVYYDVAKKIYVATMRANGERLYLGGFKTEIEAARKHNEAAILYHKEFASLNDC